MEMLPLVYRKDGETVHLINQHFHRIRQGASTPVSMAPSSLSIDRVLEVLKLKPNVPIMVLN